MSILSRLVEGTVGQKINVERLPNGINLNAVSGQLAPANQTQQLAAMTSVGWLFAVVNRIAQSISVQQWKLYRIQGGDRDEIDTHPALDLWRTANPFITREDFLETSQQHMELTGETWWVLVRNRAGIPLELQVVRPDRMRPIPHPTEFIAGYEYRMGGTAIPLEKDDVIFTRNPNPLDPYRGIGVIQSLMVDLGAERMAAEWMQNFFRNSAEPGGIIEFPNSLTDADFQRLAERWQHQGVANAHRVAILERGTWKDRTLTQRDMQFEQLRRFERDQILGAFGMPLPIMGITESVNRANAEAAEVMYARWLIRPRLQRIKAALNSKLLKLYPDGDNLEFDFVDPVPDNRTEAISEGSLGYEKRILTLNEARRRFGEDDWEGPEGDTLMSAPSGPAAPPAISAPETEEEVEEEETKPKPHKPGRYKIEALPDNEEYPDEGNTAVSRMERGWKRRLRLERDAVIEHLETNNEKGARGAVTKLTPNDLDDYNWNWWAKYGDEVVGEIAEAYSAVLVLEAPNMSIPALQLAAGRFAEVEAASLLRVDGPKNLVTLVRSRIGVLVSETISKGETLVALSKNLELDFMFSPERARTIARTETAIALGQGQKEGAKSQGRSQKRWISQGDGDVSALCELNAQQGWIPIDEAFISGDETIPQHPNCRCNVQYRSTPIDEEGTTREGPLVQADVRCPECNRKNGVNVVIGTSMRCRRCKHEWEVT
jgi:HK97 family phage portal protein